jgi:hypothetical protein
VSGPVDGPAPPRPTREPLARHLLRRLFGPATPFVLHLRPGEWPLLALHAGMGWWLATGWQWPNEPALLGIGAWVIGLNGGSLALHSAFARRSRELLFLDDPPAPPRHLAAGALGLMVCGMLVTWSLPGGYRELYVLSMALSIASSVPPLRLEAIGGADWIIATLGFSVFTPVAAWAITGVSLTGPRALAIWAFCPLFAGAYPLAQLYRIGEDREAGFRSLAARLGRSRSLVLSLLGTGFGFGMLAMAARLSGFGGMAGVARWLVLGLAALAWLCVLGPWYTSGGAWTAHEHRRALRLTLVAWALTDAAVIVAWAL